MLNSLTFCCLVSSFFANLCWTINKFIFLLCWTVWPKANLYFYCAGPSGPVHRCPEKKYLKKYIAPHKTPDRPAYTVVLLINKSDLLFDFITVCTKLIKEYWVAFFKNILATSPTVSDFLQTFCWQNLLSLLPLTLILVVEKWKSE